MKVQKMSGAALAAAAALVFTSALAGVAAADEAKVHCTGVNACKGQSSCKSANNSCKGKNSCKGQGWKSMTKAECDAAQAKKSS